MDNEAMQRRSTSEVGSWKASSNAVEYPRMSTEESADATDTDYQREFIATLLNRTQSVNHRPSADSNPDSRDSYFFQFDPALRSISECAMERPSTTANARFSVGQGKMIYTADHGGVAVSRRKSSDVREWLKELSEASEQHDGGRQVERKSSMRRETDGGAALPKSIQLMRSTSRSSRNLRDLLKPCEEDAFTTEIPDPKRGSVRRLSARRLLKRVFQWRTSTSVEKPVEEPSEPTPIDPMEEPVSVDAPVEPLPTPKPWGRVLRRAATEKKAEAPRHSQILRKVKAVVAERKLSYGMGRRLWNSRDVSEDSSTTRSSRRPTDPESAPTTPFELLHVRRRSCFTMPPGSRWTHTTTRDVGADISLKPRCTHRAIQTGNCTQSTSTATQTVDQKDQTPDPEGRGNVSRETPASALSHEDEDERGIELEEIRLSETEETPMDSFPTGFVTLQPPVVKAPPEKDKTRRRVSATGVMLDALGQRLTTLRPDIRIRIAVDLMRGLNTSDSLLS